MPEITQKYVDDLPDIYRDVLGAFPVFNPQRLIDSGVAFQSLYSALYDKYTLAEIRIACERMEEGGVLKIENEIFAHPTPLGEDLISRLSEGVGAEETVPPFSPPPTANATDK